jgi:hypothetical protein
VSGVFALHGAARPILYALMNSAKYWLLLALVSCAPTPAQKSYSYNLDLTKFQPKPLENPFQEELLRKQSEKLTRNIEQTSASFLNVPFGDGPLGEGKDGKYDNDPLFRTDLFDCTTYVETVMAIAIVETTTISNLDPRFQGAKQEIILKMLNRIRYKNGDVEYLKRNHFADLDWIQNNADENFISDDTKNIFPKALIARAIIDKAAWYAKHDIKRLKRDDLKDDAKEMLLEDLRESTADIVPEISEIPYIPLTALFTKKDGDSYEANNRLFNRILSGSIINIVRPNWNLVDSIGTHMNISHQAFLIKKDGILLIRQASLKDKKVSEMPLTEYLRPFMNSPTIKGINILRVSKFL